MTSAPTGVFQDAALLSLYLFFAFFFILVLWLHREGKREGYPLVSDRGDGRPLAAPIHGFPGTPPMKTFLLPHGHGKGPHLPEERDTSASLAPNDIYPGTSFVPTGDPMQDGVGTASWAMRADHPDLTWDDAAPKIVPLRRAAGWEVAEDSPDIRGRALLDLEGKVAGTVMDLWVDKSDVLVRYIEIELAGSGKRVLMPIGVVHWSGNGPVKCPVATTAQMAAAPATANPDQVTLREEDRISGYFGGGELYAVPGRVEPLV
jgi:photosynthetic reaction center H subunit